MPSTEGIEERLYPAPGGATPYPNAEAYPPGVAAEPPLLPRRQRRQRGALRGVAAAVVVIAAVTALGWYFRDAVTGLVSPATSPTAVAEVTTPGTPTPASESAALPNAHEALDRHSRNTARRSASLELMPARAQHAAPLRDSWPSSALGS